MTQVINEYQVDLDELTETMIPDTTITDWLGVYINAITGFAHVVVIEDDDPTLTKATWTLVSRTLGSSPPEGEGTLIEVVSMSGDEGHTYPVCVYVTSYTITGP